MDLTMMKKEIDVNTIIQAATALVAVTVVVLSISGKTNMLGERIDNLSTQVNKMATSLDSGNARTSALEIRVSLVERDVADLRKERNP